MLTPASISKKYGIPEAIVRKKLRGSNIPKHQQQYFWWIEDKYEKDIIKLLADKILKS